MSPRSLASGGAAGRGGGHEFGIDPESADKATVRSYGRHQHLQELCAEMDGQLLEQDSPRAALPELLSQIRSLADELTNWTRLLLATPRGSFTQLHHQRMEHRIPAQVELSPVVRSIVLRDRELSLGLLVTPLDKRLVSV